MRLHYLSKVTPQMTECRKRCYRCEQQWLQAECSHLSPTTGVGSGVNTHPTQNRSFQKQSSQPIT